MTAKYTNKETLFNMRGDLLICLFLTLATLIVYWQVRGHQFIGFDDPGYVTDNNRVVNGLTLENLIWAFKSKTLCNWHPLTWVSHMFDVQLYGLNPGHHHLTNVLFHILNSLLLFLIFKRMTTSLCQSGFIAALFALHPLHVESVAWVAERKDVLSTFFWMLTMWCYVHYAEQPSFSRYIFVFIFFVLGLMSKAMLVTLPFVLLLMDFWPLRRLHFGDNQNAQPRTPSLHLVLEKIPLFIVSIALSVVTIQVQKGGGAIGSWEQYPLFIRFTNALVSYLNYIIKTIWPFRLAVFYPHPGSLPDWQIAGSCMLLVSISFLAIKMLNQRPWFAVGWFWFIGTFIPVIGLVQVGLQAMADRYTYVPLIGLFIMFTWGIPELVASWRYKTKGLAAISAALLLFLMTTSWQQVSYWKNSMTIYTHALSVTSDNYLIHNNLGVTFNEQGKPDEALQHFKKALAIRPDFEPSHIGVGLALVSQGKLDECIDYYQHVLRSKPEYAKVHNNLGVALFRKGRIENAIIHFRKAIHIKGDYAEAYHSLGAVMLFKGRFDDAIGFFREALRIEPEYVQAQINLSKAMAAKKDDFSKFSNYSDSYFNYK